MIFEAMTEKDRLIDQEHPFLPKGSVIEWEGKRLVKRYMPIDRKKKKAGKPVKYGKMLYWFEAIEEEK